VFWTKSEINIVLMRMQDIWRGYYKTFA